MTRSRALVLGGTGYVGAAVLAEMAQAGVPTAFTYHQSDARARALAHEHGQHAHAIDLADPSAVPPLLADVARALGGPPDILISCATHAHGGRLADIDDQTWNRVMDVNVRGVFAVIRELAPQLCQAGGDIVLVAGPDAVGAAPSAVHFAASQAALTGLTRALAAELGPHGVRVNVLALGVLAGGAGLLLSAERVSLAQRYSAIGRIGSAQEAARAAVWLALENPYLNGTVVPITGGM